MAGVVSPRGRPAPAPPPPRRIQIEPFPIEAPPSPFSVPPTQSSTPRPAPPRAPPRASRAIPSNDEQESSLLRKRSVTSPHPGQQSGLTNSYPPIEIPEHNEISSPLSKSANTLSPPPSPVMAEATLSPKSRERKSIFVRVSQRITSSSPKHPNGSSSPVVTSPPSSGKQKRTFFKRRPKKQESPLDSTAQVANPEQDWMNKPHNPDSQIFGVSLELGVARAPSESKCKSLPLIVYRCVEFLRSWLSEEGIFRLSGSQSRILYWKKRFDLGDDPPLHSEGDPHVVSGLLKLYLRELPQSILTQPMLPHFEACLQLTNVQAQAMYLKSLLAQLPEINSAVFFYLLELFVSVFQHSSQNLMSIQNLAVIFSPGLRCTAGVVQIMLEHYDILVAP
jgi:RalA-binding protein 1